MGMKNSEDLGRAQCRAFPRAEQVLWSLFHMGGSATQQVVQSTETHSMNCTRHKAHIEKCRQGLTLLSELTQLMLALLSGKLQ